MNVTNNTIDDLNFQVTIDIAPEDYAEPVRKTLAAQRRNAEIRGFRKGMAPMSMIKRFYGEQALVDSVNKLLGDSLNNFIKENKIRVVGEPLASDDQPKNEWKDGNSFSFKFDIAQTPEISFEVGADDKVDYYKINVTEVAKKEMKENMLRQFGDLQETEKAGEEDFVIADLDNGTHKVESAYISVRSVAGEAHDLFVGAKADDQFDIDVNKAFENEADRSAMLKLKKDELKDLDPKFHVTIINVKTFVPAEENQDTYDKLFGKDKVHNAEEFDKAVVERLEANYKQESDFRLSKDLRKHFVEKAALALPEDFLKRWLIEANKEKFSKEAIEKDFANFLDDFRWQLVREYLMGKYELKVEDKDMHEAAESYAAYQYAMYGMSDIPQDVIRSGAEQLLSDEEQSRRIFDSVEDTKVVDALKKNITLNEKKISVEKFRDLK